MQSNKSYSILNDNDHNIRAVQRLRDGLIFNLGDLVNLNQDQEFPIISFKEGATDIVVTFERKTHSAAKNTILLDNLVVLKKVKSTFTIHSIVEPNKKSEEFVFTTKDGKDLTNANVCWLLINGKPKEITVKNITEIQKNCAYSNKKVLLESLKNYEILMMQKIDPAQGQKTSDRKFFTDRNYEIYKVKRKIDEKILVLGDITEHGKILSFKIHENQIRVTTDNGVFPLNMFNSKTFVLKTNDEVNIFIGDTYYWFTLKNKNIIQNTFDKYVILPFKPHTNEPRYRFSTREAAVNYLEKLKKERIVLFITEDGKEIFNGDDYWLTKEKHSTEVFYHKGDQVLTYFSTVGVKRFSTKELAEEYIKSFRKVCLITTDNINLYQGDNYYYVPSSYHRPLVCLVVDRYTCYKDSLKRFALKENAEKYRDSLKPKVEKKYTISELEKLITSPQMRANALIKQLKDAR